MLWLTLHDEIQMLLESQVPKAFLRCELSPIAILDISSTRQTSLI